MPVNPVGNVTSLPSPALDSTHQADTQVPDNPANGSAANGPADNSAAGGWQSFYNDTLQRMQQATSPDLQAHFQAELQVIAPTLAQLGINTGQSSNPQANSGSSNTQGNAGSSNTQGSSGSSNAQSNAGSSNTQGNSGSSNAQSNAGSSNTQDNSGSSNTQSNTGSGNPPAGKSGLVTGGFDSSVPNGPYTQQQTSDMAKKVATSLMSQFGFTKEQAAGIVGNLMLESGGMNPDINEMAPGSPGMYGSPASGGNGYGWGQWSSDRKSQFIDFANQNGLQVGSPAANYAYLVHELQTTQAATVDAVKATNTVPGAVDAFLKSFEKATTPNEGSRLTDANQLYAMLG
jgi:Phage tail lysozyme